MCVCVCVCVCVLIYKDLLSHHFQFVIDCTESVFSFQQVSGMVKADSRVTLPITFTPSAPINYYRRITCLVHNQVSISPFFSFPFLSLFYKKKKKKKVLETVGRRGKGRHKVTK